MLNNVEFEFSNVEEGERNTREGKESIEKKWLDNISNQIIPSM